MPLDGEALLCARDDSDDDAGVCVWLELEPALNRLRCAFGRALLFSCVPLRKRIGRTSLPLRRTIITSAI